MLFSSFKIKAETKFIFALFLIFLITIFWHYQYINAQITRDEGDRLYQSQRLLNGELPYIEIEGTYPPGSYLLIAFSFLLFGESVQTARLLILFFNIITSFALFLFSRDHWGPKNGIIASTLYICGMTIYGGHFIFISCISNFFVVVSTFFYAKVINSDNNLFTNLFLFGFFMGIASLCKQNAVLLCVGFAIFEFLRIRKDSRGNKIKRYIENTSSAFAGFIIIFSALFFYYYSIGHSDKLINDLILMPANLRGYGGIYSIHLALLKYIVFWILLAVSLSYSMLKYIKSRETKIDINLYLIFWLVFSFFPFIITGVSPIYFIFVFPPASILVSNLLISYSKSTISYKSINCNISKFMMLLLTLNVLQTVIIGGFVKNPPTLYDSEYFFTERNEESEEMLYDQILVSNYINNNTGDGEKILVFYGSPSIYFLSERESCTRWLFMHESRVSNDEDIQNEIINDLIKNKVRYVVFADHSHSDLENITYKDGMMVIAPIVYDFILQNYSHEVTIGETLQYEVFHIK